MYRKLTEEGLRIDFKHGRAEIVFLFLFLHHSEPAVQNLKCYVITIWFSIFTFVCLLLARVFVVSINYYVTAWFLFILNSFRNFHQLLWRVFYLSACHI